jgi:tetratricopeptide (TPR) repeat protein
MKKLLFFAISLGLILPCFSETVKPNAVDTSSRTIDTEHIHKILKHLGYPEHTWPDIERELIAFLTKIDFPKFKLEVAKIKSNPEQLKQFISKLGKLIEQEGCLNYQSPQPLIKLLVTSLGTEDIFQGIDTSPISQQEKENSREDIVSCSAVSQLGSIILASLDMNVKAVSATKHVFNCILLDDQRIILMDFLYQIFEIVDLNQYYKLEGKYLVLKEEYRLSPERVREIKEQWPRGVRPSTLKEVLNLPLYSDIYITDDYAVTPAIYSNRSDAHNKQGNFAQAISDSNKAIELNPNNAAAYANRGVAYKKQGNISQALSDYTKAIEINPNFVDAYNNRGNVYEKQGNFPQAILDYTKAIEIDPDYADAYYNRAITYFEQKDFDKAWENLHKAESLGRKVNPEFIRALKKASGSEK